MHLAHTFVVAIAEVLSVIEHERQRGGARELRLGIGELESACRPAKALLELVPLPSAYPWQPLDRRAPAAIGEVPRDPGKRRVDHLRPQPQYLFVPPEDAFSGWTALSGDRLAERDDVELGRAGARERPVEDPQAIAVDADVPRAGVELQQRERRPCLLEDAFRRDEHGVCDGEPL